MLGRHAVVVMLWSSCCGHHAAVTMLRSPCYGHHAVVAMLRSPCCDPHAVLCLIPLLWQLCVVMGLWCLLLPCEVWSRACNLGSTGPLYGMNNSKHELARSILPSVLHSRPAHMLLCVTLLWLCFALRCCASHDGNECCPSW